MLDRGRVGEHPGEAAALEHVAPVEDLPERGDDVTPVPGPGADAQDDLEHHDGADGQHERRQDAPRTVHPEPADGEGAVLRPLGEDDRAREEARQGEEARQREEAAAGELEALVEGEHGEEEHGAQPVERVDVRQLGPRAVGRLGRPSGPAPVVAGAFVEPRPGVTVLVEVGEVGVPFRGGDRAGGRVGGRRRRGAERAVPVAAGARTCPTGGRGRRRLPGSGPGGPGSISGSATAGRLPVGAPSGA